MKNILKIGLSAVLALIMVVGLLPVTAFAAVDNATGMPKDLNNKLILSIYTTEGKFPGEPATHGSSEYISFKSDFTRTSASGQFKSSAEDELDPSILGENVLVEGTGNSSTKVWGVFSADGLDQYFLEDASITKPENEAKIIRSIKTDMADKSDTEVLAKYEIIWYVIKMQHSPSSWWWNSGTSEWHIDGLIKEKQYVSINYYGNGNTSGSAPDGITTHTAGNPYTVLGKNTMVKKINGVEVAFLGWSAKADGTGAEAGFYQPGQVINPTESISLYAMWDTTTQYTATVNTYLDDKLTDESDIHGEARDLYLSTDEVHYYQLTRSAEGVYTTKITGNGKFHLYNKKADGTYTKVGDRQLTIYNQNGSMDVYHYSLRYDTNGGEFATAPEQAVYYFGDTATATAEVPTKEGYRFLGWKYQDSLIQPGKEVTASVTGPMELTAQWEKTVNVTVNVTIDHKGGDGYDQMDSKNEVSMALVGRENSTSPYLEIAGKTLDLSDTDHDGFTFSTVDNVTKYIGAPYTFTDLPGADAEYTVVTSKSGYDTKIESKQDKDGNWTINVVMTYNPSNFDLKFTVKVADSVPDRYIPDAAIVKVTFWSTDRNRWEIITQQEGGAPGVRVDLDAKGEGSGTYPVWKYESNGTTPYGYRIQVTSFVYPDGTIVPASQVVTQDVAWTDNVYTATVQDVAGGMKFGTLDGAYIGTSNVQVGDLTAVITMDLHNVTFNAQGGKVNGQNEQTLTEQFKVPGFKDYVPTREGGYVFDGWYLDAACTTPAVEGVDLVQDVTLYAKWKEPLTISGNVTVSGSYQQNDDTVYVHDIDRAEKVFVVLQELRNGHLYEVNSQLVPITYGENKNGTGTYSFAGIPNDGKEYRIELLVLNYGTGYDNESDEGISYSADEYGAVFGGDTEAVVNAHLDFVPPSYDQQMLVDATQIGNNFRPGNVLAEIIYRDVGDNHPYQAISQHTVEPYGVVIDLNNGVGEGTESIWKWHTDGTLYDYQMSITKVDGADFNIDTAPYYITYTAPTYWDANTNAPSGEMKATLIPKQYPVTFDLNAGEDTVTGMDNFKLTYTDDTGNEVVTDTYGKVHTWSYDTAITAVPQRVGYNFLGWETTVEGVTTDENGNKTVSAEVHQDVELTAKWEKITYTVATVSDPEEGGTTAGAGTYEHGSEVTIEATPAEGYSFLGWYENGEKVSEDAEYSFEIFANRNFTAKFRLNQYQLTTNATPPEGGTTTGDGKYDYGTEVTVTATANTGYTFEGWYNGSVKISNEPSHSVTITENLTLTANFILNQYSVTTVADPIEGGTTSGDGTYSHGSLVTVKANAETGYKFVGWYENGKQVSPDAEYSFYVTGNRDLVAKFELIAYQVTANADHGGTAEGTATYHYGDTATVTATVDETFTFDGWYEGADKVSDELAYTFTVTTDRTLTAKFVKNGYQIEAKPNNLDLGSTIGSGYYDEGSSATVTAIAKDGNKFVGWFEDGSLVSADASYTFTVEANRVLFAHFAPAYTITANAQSGGSASGTGQYTSDDTVTIRAKANSNHYFVGWYNEDDELVSTDADYTLPFKITEDRTFTAKFSAKVSYKCDYVYIFGYNDTQIGATGPLLRGELSQMIYRLVKQNSKGSTSNGGNSFSDTAGQWFESGISYMAEVGAIDKNKSSANPFASVTRGETYKMICLGLDFTDDTTLNFSDYAAILRNSGYLSDDGRVTATITRWEFCKLFNAILGRSDYCEDGFYDTTGNEVTAETYNYTDLSPDDPYYRIMMIATSTFKGDKIDLVNRMKRNTYDFTN